MCGTRMDILTSASSALVAGNTAALQVAATPRAGRGEESIDQLQCADIYISTYLDLDNCSQIYIDNPWPAAEKIASCHPRVMAEVGHKYCNMIYPLVTDKTKIPQPPLPHSGKPHKH